MRINLIKTIFFILLIIVISMPYLVVGQPSNWFGDLTSTDNSQFVNKLMINRGAFVSTDAILATVTKGDARFLYNTAANVYNPKWTGSSTNKVRNLNTKLSGEAYYGQDELWQEDFEISITSGNYYTFISSKNSLLNNDMSIIETTFYPVILNSVSQNPLSSNIYSTDEVIVDVDVNQSLNSGEYIFLRYTTDSWNTSQYIAMTQTGATTYMSTIPSMSVGTIVKYYILTTINSSPSDSDIDFLTLNLLNNNNLNYEYIVQAIPVYSGISERKIIFNEGTNYYNDFSDTALGTYGNTALLTLKGGQIETWKTSPDDITGANMYYRIYEQGATILPDFDTINLPWREDLILAGNQLWENDTMFELILNNLADTVYNIEIYYEAFYTDGISNYIHKDDNSGNNYILTFEIDSNISYGTCGIFENYIIVDTTQAVYIDGNLFHNSMIGTFYPSNNFYFKGCQAKTYKTGIFDIIEAKAYYRYYMQGSNPTSFDSFSLPWQENLPAPGNQIWENDSFDLNIINNLTYGNYYFDIYYELTYKIGVLPQIFTLVYDNSGDFYRGSFEFAPTVNVAEETKDIDVSIFPIPANDFIYINILNSDNRLLTIELKDVLGKTIIKEQTTSDKFLSLQTCNLLKGLYMIEITGDGFNYMKKALIY